jgi:hypothetical protein
LNEAAAVLSQVGTEIKFILRRNSQGDSRDILYRPVLVQARFAISKKMGNITGGDPLFESIEDNVLVESVSDALSCIKVLNPDEAEKLLRYAMRCSQTRWPQGHEIIQEIFNATADHQPLLRLSDLSNQGQLKN